MISNLALTKLGVLLKNFQQQHSVIIAATSLSSLALSVGFFNAKTAQAQVQISPMVITTKAHQGQAEGVINVKNMTNEPFRARVYVQPFTYNRDTGFQSLKSSPTDLSPYLQFSPGELTIPAGATRRIRLLSQLPPNLPDGEYRVVIFTENLKEIRAEDVNGNAISIIGKVGSTFYVRKGNVSPHLIVDSAQLNASAKKIQLLVKNTGTASVLPTATWNLKRAGKVIRSGQLPPTAIVAQSDRNFFLNLVAQNQPEITPGQYELSGELLWSEGLTEKTVPFNLNLTIPQTAASALR
ncbi:P pilus assembly protein, chaperone PapD [Nostoc sp. FACHB-280]|uniref:P pilus assembly protein, chaperone PapD n=1 Tax=Nostoc sp. FACHB-280 TaxID=2692839 RepID=UPI00168A7937|nr:P pilus assembly protein, chaperone PapD [Nostoc sp. FACHB-280]MBD2493692.1 P pilus assembly protein, chaperone PapD [Nostoc sp. FACHB-280]